MADIRLALSNIEKSVYGENIRKGILQALTVMNTETESKLNTYQFTFHYGQIKSVLYYIPVNGADLGEAFTFISDETGYIGVHHESDYSNLTNDTTAVSGVGLFAENLAGVVVGTISAGASEE